MTNTAEISIWDASDRRVLLHTTLVTLPATIGRYGAHDEGRVTDAGHSDARFGAGMTTLSREHIEVVPEGSGTARVLDKSSNGVSRLVPGEAPMFLGPNRSELIEAGAVRQFETVGLIVEVALPRPSHVPTTAQIFGTYVSSSTGKVKQIELTAEPFAIVEEGGGVQVYERRGSRVTNAAAGAEGPALIAMIGPDPSGSVVVIPGKQGAVEVNRRALPAREPLGIGHLDTVIAGPMTLQVLARGAGQALICINPECMQMNEYTPGGNCRYCGWRLGDAVTRQLNLEG
ncbi:MAG: hypothetical protein AAF914_04935 [Pseudomonadota bacterium]